MSSKSEWVVSVAGGFRAFLTVLLVAAVGLAAIGLPVAHGGLATTAEAASSPSGVQSYERVAQVESGLGSADAVYLRDDGSAVLRYDETSEVNRLEMGMAVSDGLAHALVVDDIENGNEELESANVSAVLDQSGLSGNGSLVMSQPADLQSLDLDASGKVTSETNQFDATATGTIDGQTTGAVDTNGQVRMTADRLETSGSVSIDGATGVDVTTEVSLQETNTGYTVGAYQSRTITDWQLDRWETEAQAKQTLEQQYGSLAEQLGGSYDLTINRYSLEQQASGQYRLTLDYTIEYSGIDDGLEQQVAMALANNENVDLTQAEADAIASSVTALQIETVDISVSQGGSTGHVQWDVAFANYDELASSMLDLAEANTTGEGIDQETIDDARTALEAQQASDLEWTVQWDGSVESTSTQSMQFDATVSSDTTNWDAYIDELESRGVDTGTDISFDLSAQTENGQLAVDGQFELGAEDLAQQALDSWAQSVEDGSSADQFVSALSDSDLEVARVDAAVGDGTVEIEAGAKVQNMSAITDTFSDRLTIGGMATETNAGTTSMYVHVDDMGDVDTASATKSDIDHLAVVGTETTVHAAGEWNQEFPELDTAEANAYLGLEGNDSTDDGNVDDGTDNGSVDGPTLEDYTNENGEIDRDSVFDAISDWRNGEIETELLTDVISAWRGN